MKRTNKTNFGVKHLPLIMLLISIVLTTAGCRDLLEDQTPGWLGSSIYDNLNEDGNYNNMARLIEDLNYKDILSKTGSKTLIVADDEAFDRFYSSNPWGVSRYSDLSDAQKKQLLFGSMINNSYQLNSLSSSAGPILGNCMRRLTALTVYDSVPVITPDDMPNNPFWAPYKKAGKSLVCMMDATQVPMIHFIEKQLQTQKITSDDYNFLMNYTTQHRPGDASINGLPVVGANIKCSNGFVHEVSEVMLPLQNMAELLRTKPTTTQFSDFLERFSAPFYGGINATREYNRLNGTSVDSVFQKRYFSKRSQGGLLLQTTPEGKTFDGLLKFDPGWNTYYPSTSASTAGADAMQQDMAVMLVPSDDAFERFWESGSGLILKDYFSKGGTVANWKDSIPNYVIADLINNNMLNLFQSSVPSKFNLVLNDASNPMGITVEDIDSVYFGCNGAIYLTNKVFSPTSFISVLYPAAVDERMKIVKWAADDQVIQYKAYLNSMESRYSFFLPTNDALKNYIDPVSYGRVGASSNLTYLYRFFYDYTAGSVGASVWTYDLTTNQLVDSVRLVQNTDEIRNRLKDILDSHTVVGDVEDGNTFYRTKGGTTLKVTNPSMGANGMKVWGSAQTDKNAGIPIFKVYDQLAVGGNGKTYILEEAPIMTTGKSVYDILKQDSLQFKEFIDLLEISDLLVDKMNKGESNERAIGNSFNIGFLSNFHYTLYVPTNAAIQAEYAKGLPKADDVRALIDAGQTEEAAQKQALIQQFLKYHFQDNSLFVDNNQGDKAINGRFETSLLYDGGFKTVDVLATNYEMTVKDATGVVHQVTDLNNQIAREYVFNTSDVSNPLNSSEIYSTANVVVHQISGALRYHSNQYK